MTIKTPFLKIEVEFCFSGGDCMFGRKSFFIFILLMAIMSGCAGKVPERQPITKIEDYVTSNPSEANVYWKNKHSDEVLGLLYLLFHSSLQVLTRFLLR